MKAEETSSWHFQSPVTDDCSIRCPECKEVTPLASWREGEVYCETCGDHSAMICPACYECFDHVWSPTFEVVHPSRPTFNPEVEVPL